MKFKSLVYHFLSQLKPASNEALFSSFPVCRQNELKLQWFCSHKHSLALRYKRHETSLLMRWYLHCDTTFHPSNCKGFANIDLSFTNPRSWRNVCFRKVGWPGLGRGWNVWWSPPGSEPGRKPWASAPVSTKLCHWTGWLVWERKILGNAAAWAGKWTRNPCP